jgi:Ca-activated chloride channel family protein
MKNQKTFKLYIKKAQLLTLLIFAMAFTSTAQQYDFEDKTESPYFLVKGNTENISLPLKSTTATVSIAGVIADVKVKQVYTNTGENTINATYVFPGSTKSAVYGMQMKIENRVIIAEIKEKEEAKEIFEQAKSEGKNASLLQQQRPNVFQMDVANIKPGQTIIVELFYNELITPEAGIYEFVYPKVVGPRYADEEGMIKDPWVQNPHSTTKKGSAHSKSTFNIKVNLNTSLPLQQVQSFSHKVNINYSNGKSAIVQLKSPKAYLDSKDFILNYSLAGGKIESGISLYEGEKENFFLMMMEPPKRVKSDEITPREYIFIVDVSGSMNGFPLDITKKLMEELLEKLTPVDRFNILLFASSSDVLSENSLSVTPENIKKGINFINKEHGSGGTDLLPALKRSLALPKSKGYSRSIVITTDGYVTVEKEAFDLIKENLGKANFFSFGIGTNINRYLIEGLARVGKGEPLVITNEVDAKEKASKFIEYIQSPILTDIKINFKGLDAYDIEPATFPDLFAERPILVYGKWKGKPKGKIEIKGKNNSGQFKSSIEVTKDNISNNNEALKYLWARNKIMDLSDYNSLSGNDEFKSEIIDLGLTYNLLTQYTSFVGVDDGIQSNESIQQNSNSGAVPEPHEWALIITSLLFLSFLIYQRYAL